MGGHGLHMRGDADFLLDGRQWAHGDGASDLQQCSVRLDVRRGIFARGTLTILLEASVQQRSSISRYFTQMARPLTFGHRMP